MSYWCMKIFLLSMAHIKIHGNCMHVISASSIIKAASWLGDNKLCKQITGAF